jgi:3-deoxy-D-manno-octulosonic-acid transferase
MFKLYAFLVTMLQPFIYLLLNYRRRIGKEHATRFPERLGIATKKRPNGKIIWFHAASVGELNAILPLINHMAKDNHKLNILVTTVTLTSAAIAQKNLPKNSFHQFVPIDTNKAVKRFLAHWKPDLAIWTESELWPNLIHRTHKVCRLILLNARISDRSYSKWLKYRFFAQRILAEFDLILPQENTDLERLKSLGAKNIQYIGNLKYDAPALAFDKSELAKLKAQIGKRPVFVAASTHSGEEVEIIKCHKILQEKHPNLLTIIVPRHSKRSAEIAEGLSTINFATRSINEKITAKTAIYLADTMGELGLFYSLADVSFVGGSLMDVGGHNPLEPARFKNAIISGAHIFNFTTIYNEMQQAKAILIANDCADLAKKIDQLLNDKDKRELLGKNAFALAASKKGITEKAASIIKERIGGIAQ